MNLPARRPHTSIMVLAILFLAVLAAYFLVRPLPTPATTTPPAYPVYPGT